MNYIYNNKTAYSEEGQINPIRWAILSGTPKTGLVNESAWLRCKDFFNDYAVAYNGGPRFGIYGFSTEKMKIPERGQPVYMAVKDVTHSFVDNLNVINKEMPAKVIAHKSDDGTFVLEIPGFFFASTYNISLLSLMIRLCNIEHKFTTWEEFVNYPSYNNRDKLKWDVVVKAGKFFNIPDKFKKYVWYCDEKYNSEKAKDVPVYQLSSLVHNNGVVSYSKLF